MSRRRVRLLAWLLVWLLVLMFLSAVLVLAVDARSSAREAGYLEMILAFGLVFTVAYLVNAAGHYQAAAWLTLVPAVLQPWAALAFDHAILRGDFVPLLYASVAILLSSFLFSPLVTHAVAFLELVGLTLIPVLSPASRTFNWPSGLALVVVISALSILNSAIVEKDLTELDAQSKRLAESEAQLRELSIRDPLTGLFNRRHLEESLLDEIGRANRADDRIGVIAFDVDNLKQINDAAGHAAGDVMLRRLAEIATSHSRGSDLACRCGGDEFVFVLPGATREVTLSRAEFLRTTIAALCFEHDDVVGAGVTISLGVAVYPDDGTDPSELLRAADDALYRAKREGRNRVAVVA